MSNTAKVIAIDCGKMNLKAKCGVEEIFYKNAYSLHNGDEGMLGKNTFNVEWKGTQYIVGDNASKMMSGEGKENDYHILGALVASTHFLEPDVENQEVYMMYGESVARYYNMKHKEEIKKKLEKFHEITVGGKVYKFTVKVAHILPEGVGHILHDLKTYRGVQRVVDIGGATINYLTVKNGLPIESQSRSFPLGVHNIRAKVIDKLNKDGYTIDELTVDEYLMEGAKNAKVQGIINDVIQEQLEELDTQLKNIQVDLHKLLEIDDVVFVGGGSELLKTEIQKYYKGATVLKDAMLCNVRGFFTYGLAKYGQLPSSTN